MSKFKRNIILGGILCSGICMIGCNNKVENTSEESVDNLNIIEEEVKIFTSEDVHSYFMGDIKNSMTNYINTLNSITKDENQITVLLNNIDTYISNFDFFITEF